MHLFKLILIIFSIVFKHSLCQVIRERRDNIELINSLLHDDSLLSSSSNEYMDENGQIIMKERKSDENPVTTDGKNLRTIRKIPGGVKDQAPNDPKYVELNFEPNKQTTVRHLLGGLTDQDPNDPKYVELANESMQKYLDNLGTFTPYRVVGIKRVTSQVVAGTLTRIDFVASPVKYTKGDILNCHSKIWEKEWLSFKNIKVTCKPNKQTTLRHLVGGLTDQDPNDPKYVELANESMQKYLDNLGTFTPYRVVGIKRVTSQVVAGTLTRIDFVASPVKYTKGDILNCHSKILEKKWLSFKNIKVSCEPKKQTTVRHLLGGLIDQDPNDPKYVELAKESMQKYLDNLGTFMPYRVVRIKRVTSQVVAGTLTRIDFVASPVEYTNGDILCCHSKILEQSWLGNKDIDVSCEPVSRIKRQTTEIGVETQVNPKDEKYETLAFEALQKYLDEVGISKKYTVFNVKKVTTQPVGGILTKIDFIAIPITDNKDDNLDCRSEIWQKEWLNLKTINVSCEAFKAPPDDFKVEDPNDPKYVKLANEMMEMHLNNINSSVPYQVVHIGRVTTQATAGVLTKMIFEIAPINSTDGDYLYCNSEMSAKPWLNWITMSVSCKPKNRRTTREIPGSVTDQNPNDSKYVELAKESMQKYLDDLGTFMPYQVVRIKRVTSKVVEGTLTRIDFVASPVKYTKGDILNCHSKIWEKEWLSFKNINVTCEPNKQTTVRHLLGGLTDQDPNDPKYVELANESIRKYLDALGTFMPYQVVRIKRVTSQVVEGTLTRLDFVATPVEYTKGDILNCHSKIWEKKWLNFKNIDVNCEPNKQTTVRQIPGGVTEQDPNDPKYLELAKVSMQKYLDNVGSSVPHQVDRIEKVTSQVVGGYLTRIHFVASPIQYSKHFLYCHSTILEQPWHEKKDINVSCDLLSLQR